MSCHIVAWLHVHRMAGIMREMELKSSERLIVALDLPTHDEAIGMVETLDNVSLFKIGLQLLMAGDLMAFLRRLRELRGEQGGVFIDLKIAGDIGNTINSFVTAAADLGIRFITLVEAAEPAITDHTLAAGRQARGPRTHPEFLMVPLLSSLSEPVVGSTLSTDDYIVRKGDELLKRGCDGLVVSGTAIGACRAALAGTTLVSPGIRPAWAASPDDHARYTTPAEAITLGADYLVVGRPVLQHASPRQAAQRIIEEIHNAKSG